MEDVPPAPPSAPSIVSRDHRSSSPGPTDCNLSAARDLGKHQQSALMYCLFLENLREASMFLLVLLFRDFEICFIDEFCENVSRFCCTDL